MCMVHTILTHMTNNSFRLSRSVYCKARYAVLFQIRTFPPEPEDEAHIGPTVTYDKVIYPGFQHDITTLQIQGYNISYNRHTTASIQYISRRDMPGYMLQTDA